MKILIAEDDAVSRKMLEGMLKEWGFSVRVACDGEEAWSLLQTTGNDLAILDWEMPGLDGTELCRRLRQRQPPTPMYLILLTGRDNKADVVAGLEAGANDYVTKPFDRAELRARVSVGRTVSELQATLASRVEELEATLARVKQIQGILRVCSYCRKIHVDGNCWQQMEEYLAKHSEMRFSHGICPSCWQEVIEPQLRAGSYGTPGNDAPS